MIWVHAGALSRFLDLRQLYQAARELPAAGFVGIYIAASLVSFPTFLLSIVGGALYGMVPGAFWVLIGANAGAWAGFGVGRILGSDMRRRWIERHEGMRRFEDGLKRHGLLFVLQVRCLPVVPFAWSNFAFGALGCPFWKFALGTAVGMIPFTLIYTYFGMSLQAASEVSPFEHLWISLALMAGVTLISFWLARRRKREALSSEGR